jgi:hypothetical protein
MNDTDLRRRLAQLVSGGFVTAAFGFLGAGIAEAVPVPVDDNGVPIAKAAPPPEPEPQHAAPAPEHPLISQEDADAGDRRVQSVADEAKARAKREPPLPGAPAKDWVDWALDHPDWVEQHPLAAPSRAADFAGGRSTGGAEVRA